ncbi:MAG: alpha/beta hydrolase [Candidatus Atribacteria bacterium]|nr:alpha/beta hydrolase [Candidatus Atribacteria bacterium]
MVLRSSVLLLIFLLIMSYVSVKNAEELFTGELKDRVSFSWDEGEMIKKAIIQKVGLPSSDKKVTDILMPPEALAKYVEGVVYKDIEYGDHPEEKLNVIIPLSIRTNEKLPVFVFIHGGTWMAGTKDSILYSQFAKEILKDRCIFVTLNYRLFPKVRFPEILDDPTSAITWVYKNISQYGGDPNKIILCGHSAGAHLAALLAVPKGYLPDRVYWAIKKVLLLSGPYDLPRYDETLGIGYEKVVKEVFLNLFGGRKNLESTSPVDMVHKNHMNFLLVVGDKDEVTPLAQSQELYRALKEKGNTASLFVLPGSGHGGTVFYLNGDFGSKTALPMLVKKFLTF